MTQSFVSRAAVVLAVCGGVILFACEEKKKAPPASKPAPVAEGFLVDETLATQVRSIAKDCQIDSKRATITCPDGRDKTLVRELLTDKHKRTKTLETFVALLQQEDEKTPIVAASILYDATRAGMEEGAAPGSVSKKVAAALREQFTKGDPHMSRLLAPAATHASALAGDLPVLFQELEGKASEAAAALRFVMVYGRLEAFQEIQKFAQDQRSGVRLAALEAPRNMRRWTPKDRAAICPWAVSLLDDKRPMVASRAAALLTRCAGEYVDRLLESGEKALQEGQFARGDLPPYRDLCSGMRQREGGAATKEQCARNRELLVRVTESDKLDEQTRGLSLSALAYQWPDGDTLKLAERYAKGSKDSVLKEQATRAVERLRSRHEAESKSKQSPSTTKVGGLSAPASSTSE